MGEERGVRSGDRGSTAVAELPLTVRAAVAALEDVLRTGGVELPRDEARDMLAALLDVPRFWPTLNADAPVERALWTQARAAAARRVAGAPFAYAVGRAAFRHLTLDVDERVLVPRQETETLVEEVLRLTSGGAGTAVDIGTGSGAIALALASEGRFDRVIATDLSLDALAVARRNAELLAGALRATVEFRHGAFCAPLGGVRASLVVSNPPYIAFDEAIGLPPSVRDWEPGVALFAAEGGMAAIAEIVRGAAGILEPGGLLALEVDSRRASLAAERVAADGRYREIAVLRDLAGRERIVVARGAGTGEPGTGTRDGA